MSKIAFIHATVLDGTKEMLPQENRTILVEKGNGKTALLLCDSLHIT